MNDDLLDADWTAHESALLGSAQLDVAPEGSSERTLAALGLGVALGASSGALAAASVPAKAAAANSVAVWLKWAASALVGVGAVAAAVVALRPPSPAPVVAPPPRSEPSSVAPTVEAPSAPLAREDAASPALPGALPSPPDAEQLRAGIAPPPQPPKAKSKVPIADEIKAIDDARTLLRAGNYTAALQFLDSYDKMVGRHGAMQTEATVVRIEVLKAKGDRAAALALGKRFLAAHPKGPYAFYVKRLLGLPLGEAGR